MSMNKIASLIEQGFESSTGPTPEFNAFAKKFRSAIAAELKKQGCKLIKFSKGHFEVSGTYQSGDNVAYFSLPDVRMGSMDCRLMYRNANDGKTGVGSANNWVAIKDGIGEKLSRIPAR